MKLSPVPPAVDAWKGGTEDVVVVVGDQPFVDGSPGDNDWMDSPSLVAEHYHVGEGSFSPLHGCSPRTSHAGEVSPCLC